MDINNILDFWFLKLTPQDWFKKSESLDLLIKNTFLSLYLSASAGELFNWRSTINGRLAEIIILDQFPRNMFRDSPQAFQFDNLALVLSQEASQLNDAKLLPPIKKAFLYMPFMHSESKIIHDHAVTLFSEPGLESNLEYELKHKKIIDRFNRYPHRNSILGRISTQEEVEFLKTPGSKF